MDRLHTLRQYRRVVLDDAHVSRSHARIEYNGKKATFTDLGSHHGSWLNGNKILNARLKNGDILKIGGCDVFFEVRQKKKLFGGKKIFLHSFEQVFVGIDVIGGNLTEINVTSPTGIQELERFDGINVAEKIWLAIEARRAG